MCDIAKLLPIKHSRFYIVQYITQYITLSTGDSLGGRIYISDKIIILEIYGIQDKNVFFKRKKIDFE